MDRLFHSRSKPDSLTLPASGDDNEKMGLPKSDHVTPPRESAHPLGGFLFYPLPDQRPDFLLISNLTGRLDGLVKSKFSPPLAGGDEGEGENLQKYG